MAVEQAAARSSVATRMTFAPIPYRVLRDLLQCSVSPPKMGTALSASQTCRGPRDRRRRQVVFVGKVIQIGRLASSHLRIQEASRKHALIKVSKRAAVIIDQGSDKGTWVNGRRVKKASLKDGDLLQLGDTEVVVGIGR